MQVLDAEKWKQKLNDAKRTGKLNISYFSLPEITAAQVEDIKVRTRDTTPTRSVLFGPLGKKASSLCFFDPDSSTSGAACLWWARLDPRCGRSVWGESSSLAPSS